ncbi:MAG: Gfo/Idh/MocA family oxidoreductase [Phycisphaerae bacterium]
MSKKTAKPMPTEPAPAAQPDGAMRLKACLVGLESVQQDWLTAIAQAADIGLIEVTAAGHSSVAEARDLAQHFDAPFYDDLRRMMLTHSPQIIILDRPPELGLDFIEACLQQQIGILSLGPVVSNLTEARQIAAVLKPKTHLLLNWPLALEGWAFKQCLQTQEYFLDVSLLTAGFFAINHAIAKSRQQAGTESVVRSMSVLAWDAMRTIIELLGLPASVYACIDGSVGEGDRFHDATGSAAATLRFADGGACGLAISDRETPARRELLVQSRAGSVRMTDFSYRICDSSGKLIEEDTRTPILPAEQCLTALQDFCRGFTAPPSPHRGWNHLLVETSATMVAMLISNRTGAAESPQRLIDLRA